MPKCCPPETGISRQLEIPSVAFPSGVPKTKAFNVQIRSYQYERLNRNQNKWFQGRFKWFRYRL